MIEAIVTDTLTTVPDDDSPFWTTRTLVERHDVGKDTVARVWKKRRLRPWKVDTYKLSTDPAFEQQLVDIVALYMDPPDHAAVFCFDEKAQIQALDRTQPSLPTTKGRARTMTHDYKRNGVIDLFAALNVGTGESSTQPAKPTPAKTDAWSCRIVGWSIADHMRADVVVDAITMTGPVQPPMDPAPIPTTEPQYTSWAFIAGSGNLCATQMISQVMCRWRSQGQRALQVLEHEMEQLGLRLHPDKTRIVYLADREGFDFLGFHHRWAKAPGRNLWFLARWPSRRAMARARQRIRELTARALTAAPVEAVIGRLNRFLAGWAGYFRHGNGTEVR